MEFRSQAQLEKLIHQQELMDLNLIPVSDQVFEMEDWIVEIGQRKALLVPKTKQWMWYDSLHDEWSSANCGIDEAILVAFGKIAGMKKLPQHGDVSEWCVYMLNQQPFGPLRTEELINKLVSHQLPLDIRVWSPLATTWLIPSQIENKIVFTDENGNQIPITVNEEVSPPSAQIPPEIPQSAPPVLQVPVENLQLPPVLPGDMLPPEISGAQAETVIHTRFSTVEVVVLNGELANKRFLLEEQLGVGRDQDNALVLPDPQASRHHATFQRQGTIFQITDLSSSNGTYVNEKVINTPTLLKDGDIIRIGDTRLTIVTQ
jgi:hypothetical protein